MSLEAGGDDGGADDHFTQERVDEIVAEETAELRGLITVRERQALAQAADIARLRADRDEQDRALRDAIRETAACADKLAFWRYQAIYGRAYMLDPSIANTPFPTDKPVWKEALRQLDGAHTHERD